jgi:hypothetical protein
MYVLPRRVGVRSRSDGRDNGPARCVVGPDGGPDGARCRMLQRAVSRAGRCPHSPTVCVPR